MSQGREHIDLSVREPINLRSVIMTGKGDTRSANGGSELVHFTQVIPACYTVCGAEDSELKGGFKMNIIIGIIVGGIAGWLAGQIMGSRFSVLGNVIIGVVGGFVGSTVLRLVGIYSYGMIGNIIVAVIGACICIAVMRMLK